MSTADWRIDFIGTGSLISHPFRALPATLVNAGDFHYLFDCGDGTVDRLRAIDKIGVDIVAVTAIGASELSGVLHLAEVHRRSQRRRLPIAGPAGLQDAIEGLCSVSAFSTAELFEILVPDSSGVIHTHGRQHLEAIPMAVPGDHSNAYGLYEEPLPGRVDAKKAKERGIKGNEFSRLLAGETIRRVRPDDVIGPSRLGRRFVLSGRGRATEQLKTALQGSDVAVFATPFTDDRLEVAAESGYFTGWEAAEIAYQHQVKLPVIQRLGTQSRPSYQLAEARQFNRRILAVHDRDWVQLPLPEKGSPAFHRGSDAANLPPTGSKKTPWRPQPRSQRPQGRRSSAG
jgi:ribonuclease Z